MTSLTPEEAALIKISYIINDDYRIKILKWENVSLQTRQIIYFKEEFVWNDGSKTKDILSFSLPGIKKTMALDKTYDLDDEAVDLLKAIYIPNLGLSHVFNLPHGVRYHVQLALDKRAKDHQEKITSALYLQNPRLSEIDAELSDLLEKVDLLKTERQAILNQSVSLFARLEELDLDVRTYNALMRAGIDTVSQVLELMVKGKDWVLCIRNFGEKAYRDLTEKLLLRGYVIPYNTEIDKQDSQPTPK